MITIMATCHHTATAKTATLGAIRPTVRYMWQIEIDDVAVHLGRDGEYVKDWIQMVYRRDMLP